MHNDAAHREASRVLIAPCGLRDQTAESDDAGTPIPQRASGGVGSALMFRGAPGNRELGGMTVMGSRRVARRTSRRVARRR